MDEEEFQWFFIQFGPNFDTAFRFIYIWIIICVFPFSFNNFPSVFSSISVLWSYSSLDDECASLKLGTSSPFSIRQEPSERKVKSSFFIYFNISVSMKRCANKKCMLMYICLCSCPRKVHFVSFRYYFVFFFIHPFHQPLCSLNKGKLEEEPKKINVLKFFKNI